MGVVLAFEVAPLYPGAGTAAGATTWVVDDCGSVGVDYMMIQAAVWSDR